MKYALITLALVLWFFNTSEAEARRGRHCSLSQYYRVSMGTCVSKRRHGEYYYVRRERKRIKVVTRIKERVVTKTKVIYIKEPKPEKEIVVEPPPQTSIPLEMPKQDLSLNPFHWEKREKSRWLR
jgi:hypothetical protein